MTGMDERLAKVSGMGDPSVESWRAIWIPRDHFAPEFEAFPTEAAAEAFAEQGVREGVAREFYIVRVEEGQ